jgi:methyl-accepting chemotaxis protein
MPLAEDEDFLNFDFNLEVQETKDKIEETEKTLEKSGPKAEKIVSKMEKISKSFDIAESQIVEMTEVIQSEVSNVKNLPTMNISDMFQLDMLQSDFMAMRSTLMDTVTKGKLVIDAITNEIVINPTDAEMVGSYSQLISVVNSSMKLLSSTYKDIGDIVARVKKLEEVSKPEVGNVTNIQNNFYAESTSDIIKQLRDSKNNV